MSKAGSSAHGYQLITVPHEGKPAEAVCRQVKESLSGLAEVYRFVSILT